MKVSLIVPAYNEEKKIAKTLEGLKKQTYANYELIVIDNNSTDKTNEIAKKFTSTVFIEKEKGYIHAANTGAKMATGELITFCDADSQYPEDWLEKVVAAFKLHPEAVAVYGTCSTYDASPILNFINYYLYTWFLMLSRLLGLDNTSGFNFVMKKEGFIKVQGFDPNYQKMSPDLQLGIKLKKFGKIIFDPKIKVLSSFRRFEHGGTIKTTLFFMKSWLQILIGKDPTISYEEYNKEIR
ncbi:MAG: glycosyltransferase family A protein [Candidatus Margulisiibacteriota bacterium]|jgi:glycosyltransferase involved in cell wall biosynthesis